MNRKSNPNETLRQGAAPAKSDSRKKLTVRREMLRTLDGDLLRAAAGGIFPATYRCPTW